MVIIKEDKLVLINIMNLYNQIISQKESKFFCFKQTVVYLNKISLILNKNKDYGDIVAILIKII